MRSGTNWHAETICTVIYNFINIRALFKDYLPIIMETSDAVLCRFEAGMKTHFWSCSLKVYADSPPHPTSTVQPWTNVLRMSYSFSQSLLPPFLWWSPSSPWKWTQGAVVVKKVQWAPGGTSPKVDPALGSGHKDMRLSSTHSLFISKSRNVNYRFIGSWKFIQA